MTGLLAVLRLNINSYAKQAEITASLVVCQQ